MYQAELDAKKAKKTKLPDMGLSRPGQVGKGGTIGASNSSLLTQHILKQQVRAATMHITFTCGFLHSMTLPYHRPP